MRALLVCLFLAVTTLMPPDASAQGLESGMLSVRMRLAEDAGMSGVDRRLIVCQINPRLLHTVWVPNVKEPRQPQVCTGGANRLGAGYVRYLSTSRVSKAQKPLRE